MTSIPRATRAALTTGLALSLVIAVAAATVRAAGGAWSPADATATAGPDERLESMTGPLLLETAQAEFRKAASVTMTGFALKDEHRATFTVSADREGNCTATTIQEGQGPSRIARVQGETFVRMDPQAFAREWGEAIASRFGGRWVRLPAGRTLDGVGGFCDLTTVPVVGTTAPATQTLSGAGESVGGTRSMSFLVTSPDEPPFIAYIAKQGPPRPVRVETQAYDFQVDFSAYDLPVFVTAPPADQVVDLAALTESPS
ncbi:hypothetical protein ABTX81_32840 [Kitasatospora sp. NPDC097605]|uniref:hypothetical protein n=1 Tax=Kitasatospora sp. NPDC097605 TaxID=3157226 RepID=UPI003326E389